MAAPEYYDAQPAFLKNTMSRTRWGWRFDTPEKYQSMVKGYYRMISGIDLVLGRIRGELSRLGLAGNTVIIFTSDNGYFLGERGYADKWLMYEPSIRIPLVVYDPRAPRKSRGLVKRDMVLNIDLAPTLMDLAGIGVPPQTQGRSLKPLLGRKRPAWRSEVFCEELWDHPDIPRSECVRTKRWKYIQYPAHPEYVELFDLADDPDEKRNLAGDPRYARVLAALRRRCARTIRELLIDQAKFR
jgi:arylsulfatase A-like enzyme